MSGADEIFRACITEPAIPCIIAHNDGRTSAYIPDTRAVTPTFATCAAILMLDNGEIGNNVYLACMQLKQTLQKPVSVPPSYDARAKALQNQLLLVHNGTICNCAQLILDISACEDDIMTQQEFYEYTVRLRAGINEAEFQCVGLKDRLLDAIPNEPDYGETYQSRIPCGGIDSGMISYMHWDEDDQKMVTETNYDSDFSEYPAYDLARAILQHGISFDTLASLAEDNKQAREMIKTLL